MQPRRVRLRRGTLLALVCVVTVSMNGCSNAGQRLKDAAKVIAARMGSTADEVESNLKIRFASLDEAQLADEAEASVRRTSWLDDFLARAAANKVKTARAVRKSTCQLIDDIEWISALTANDQGEAVLELVLTEMKNEGLSTEQDDVEAFLGAMQTQLVAMENTGSFDYGAMTSDFLCLA